VDYNSKIPSRGRFLELGEADPSPFISATIQELSEAGASVAVVPCNTAHIFFESWSSNSNIPVINIIEATSRKAKLEGMTRVIVLSSKNLSFSGTYSKYLARVQIEHELVTDEFQQIVDRTIGLVKLGEVDGQEAQDSILRLISYIRSKSVSGIILGCTELGVFVSWFREAGIRVVDSGLALAEAARLSIYE
jgi:aspartate racemase